jgi:hypothetical protein
MHRTGGKSEPAISGEDWWLLAGVGAGVLLAGWALVASFLLIFGGPDLLDVQVISNGNELLELRCEEWRR